MARTKRRLSCKTSYLRIQLRRAIRVSWIRAILFLSTISALALSCRGFSVSKRAGTVLHVSHRGGGVERYYSDLIRNTKTYEHVVSTDLGTVIDVISTPRQSNHRFVMHIHSAMLDSSMGWRILDLIRRVTRERGLVILTVHDFQWLLPQDPNNMANGPLERANENDKRNTITLFKLCDVVIFPSRFTKTEYDRVLGVYRAVSVVVPHPDYAVLHHVKRITPFNSRIVNVGFFGEYSRRKGARILFEVIDELANLGLSANITIFGQVLGAGSESLVQTAHLQGIHMYGRYRDDEIIETLDGYNLHLIAILSDVNETYCYAATHALNSGLPILHTGRGALGERLSAFHRAFDTSSGTLSSVLRRLVAFMRKERATAKVSGRNTNNHIVFPKWYSVNYPHLAFTKLHMQKLMFLSH